MKFDFPNFRREELREVISVATLFHDFGKATSFFQNYITNPTEPSNESSRRKRSHGLISSLLTFGILKEKFPDNLILQLFGLIIVRKHHGNLENFVNMLIFDDNDLKNVILQAENISFDELQHITSKQNYKNFLNFEFIIKTIKFFQPRTPRKVKRLVRNFSIEHYFLLNLLYSILLQADKTDAILRDYQVLESKMLKSEDVHIFKNHFIENEETSINKIRENAFNSVENSIDRLKDIDKILSINIPTGSGKTITSFNAALKLCEKFNHDHIIYCLPFTSVIDQNFKVFDEIRQLANLPDSSDILLKHHYLTDISYKTINEENLIKKYSLNEALHLIEGWESKIIVTTFVQLLYSLISYKNSSLRKFNRFSNAVIILDEIQSIPYEYWNLIRTIFFKIVKLLNSKIILVTATMPLIFSESNNEIKELVPKKKKIFESLNRIQLDVSNLNNEKMDWIDFCSSITTLVLDNSEKDILFIMNTIRSARELFTVLSKNNKVTHKLIFLSSHIIPQERLRRIRDIKNRTKNEHILVVSTQLVEAGVDIDLDIVVRDFAPLDNIFQACGRCNRESKSITKGRVILYSLKDSNNWTPSGIYKDFLKQKTKKVLENKKIIHESEFHNLAYEYFNEIKTGSSQRYSNLLLEKIKKLEYQNGEENIELEIIQNDYSSSIFIEIDETAKNIWQSYQNVLEMENGFDKYLSLKQARKKLAEYIINIPKRCLPLEYHSSIYHLRFDRIKEYYDSEMGFDISKVLPIEESVLIL